ncbi:MAG: DUF983 domain-containing protein [Chloroflexi bacterium]|nr:DUF983 domain-containing protein [Chloroflexota bacterium]MDL1883122.1 DUF983 domain-containing protein [Anaerolineae bacterium CFX8]
MKGITVLRKLLLGLLLRCPNCGRGRLFDGLFNLFRMEATCPDCHVRYERQSGESIGGTLINLCLAEVLSVGGYFATQAAFAPPLAFQLIFWITFNIVFIVLFYRHARGLWVSIAYLTGGVYPDADARQRHTGTDER